VFRFGLLVHGYGCLHWEILVYLLLTDGTVGMVCSWFVSCILRQVAPICFAQTAK
jgi:hypothetical protein